MGGLERWEREGEEREKGQGQAAAAGASCHRSPRSRTACSRTHLHLAILCQQPGCSFWLVIATNNGFFTEVFFPTIDYSYKPKLAAVVQAEFSSIRGHFSSVNAELLSQRR